MIAPVGVKNVIFVNIYGPVSFVDVMVPIHYVSLIYDSYRDLEKYSHPPWLAIGDNTYIQNSSYKMSSGLVRMSKMESFEHEIQMFILGNYY